MQKPKTRTRPSHRDQNISPPDTADRLKAVSSNHGLLVASSYDDWNLIEERIAYTNGTSSTIRYSWGKDLSGTLQGAGGVGGLLYLTVDGAIYIPCYDANGNITRYLDATGNTVAQYTYDAFGNSIATSGPLVDLFRHRFSTKYYDFENELYYYGYRFYNPSHMRWLTRDPIEEEGGENLYAFCMQNALCLYDADGCIPLDAIWDIGNIIYDLCVGDDVALAADTAALMISYLPAGSTKLVKAAKASKVQKICPDANKLTITYKYVTHGNKHFKLAAKGKLPIDKRATWVLETVSGPSQFLPGITHKQGTELASQAIQAAKTKTIIKPAQLNGYVHDTGKIIGASGGRLTTKVQIYVTPQGEIHVRPK